MKVVDRIKNSLGWEYDIVYKHPMKEYYLLMDCEGDHMWIPLYILVDKYKKIL